MQNELIQALLDPARYSVSYPHPVEQIELRETHISWVLLTGEFAYKIKKPVKLSFLDFSTLELRRHYCEEELRLNRRFAPELYLAVVAITGSPQSPRIGGNEIVVDYAVQLRQFRAQDELTRLLAADAIDDAAFTDFGHALAQTHATLPRIDSTVADLTRAVALNLDDLQRLFPDTHRIVSVCNDIAQLERTLQTELQRRYATGAIRDCHGDLHAGNVVRQDGRLIAFDCIEFDPKLRQIDVLNDLSFLFMDLLTRRHRTGAYNLLNAWLEATGDYAGLPLLHYYAAHRALVRAKVLALQDQRDRMIDAYVNVAETFVTTRRPRLVITCGLSGSGKTWLAQRLAGALPAVHVRSDIERKRLAGLDAMASSKSAPGGGIYSLDFNARTYDRLADCARAALRGGENIIVDAAFLRRAERMAFRALAEQLDTSFTILHCVAPDSDLRDRIAMRTRQGTDASEATIDVLQRQFEFWEPLIDSESGFAIEADTRSVDLDELARTLQAVTTSISK